MQLEQYFDFLAPDDIRIKGHRIGIESVLYEYLFREQTPEQIASPFPIADLGTGLRHDSLLPQQP